MPGFSNASPAHAVLLEGTSAISFAAGVAGSSGAAGDTLIYGFHILSNATAVTVALTGFINSSASNATITWTGSTSADVIVQFPAPLLNEFAALTATPSVSAKVWLYVGAYNAEGSG